MQVLEAPATIADEIVFMKCPFCRHDIAATWQFFVITTDHLGRQLPQFSTQLQTAVARGQTRVAATVSVHWLLCQNVECQEIIVQITRAETGEGAKVWTALPQRPAVPVVNLLVTDPFKKDYLEAWAILEDSPRMSAVLSRRLLADLLEKYAGLKQGLAQRIDEFIKDTHHPLWIRENLHYLREMGNFGAHSQQDQTALTSTVEALAALPAEPAIINVDKEEAAWTLAIIADLFEYFIVAPEKDKAIREKFDKKLVDAKRKPITRLTS